MDAKCPVCGKSFNPTFSDIEIAQGGRNAICPRCKKVLWITINGKIKSISAEDSKKERCVMISCGAETPYTKDTPINERKYYARGAGQLCEKCGEKYYSEGGD